MYRYDVDEVVNREDIVSDLVTTGLVLTIDETDFVSVILEE